MYVNCVSINCLSQIGDAYFQDQLLCKREALATTLRDSQVRHNGARTPVLDEVAQTVSIARIQEKDSSIETGVRFKKVRLKLRMREEWMNLKR